jgi:hypothetical protein
MVRIDFPAELLSSTFLEALIRESKEDFVIKRRVEAAQAVDSPLRPFFEPAYGYYGGGAGGCGYGGGGYKVSQSVCCGCMYVGWG